MGQEGEIGMWNKKGGVRRVEKDRRKGWVGKNNEMGAVGGEVQIKEKKVDNREWKRNVMGAEEKGKQWRHERIMFISFTMDTHTHYWLWRTCYWTTSLGFQSQTQNTLEKLTAKPTNKVPVKQLLRKSSHIFLGYSPASTAEVWSNKSINVELLCAVAKQVSTQTTQARSLNICNKTYPTISSNDYKSNSLWNKTQFQVAIHQEGTFYKVSHKQNSLSSFLRSKSSSFKSPALDRFDSSDVFCVRYFAESSWQVWNKSQITSSDKLYGV